MILQVVSFDKLRIDRALHEGEEWPPFSGHRPEKSEAIGWR